MTPSLDTNSAHPRIKISRDLKTATRTKTRQQYPKHPVRFDCFPQVVSCESFSSGRHYWEVDVSLSSWCEIGICLNSIRRKGFGRECRLGGNPQSWCLYKYNNKYCTRHNNQDTPLSVSGDPERFGFFLDCEAGELTCFGDSRAGQLTCFGDSRVLHVFRGNFMDPVKPVKPAIGVYDPVGDSVRFL
uniref:B30.2/SPRY domain-containing protein n=1 Tax=Eptatretus burgeri TaxID=7764 RepID=A0A8C4R383_EPTBU